MADTTVMASPSDVGVEGVPPAGDRHQALWMLNSLMIERATVQETGGAYTVHEQWITPAGNPPPHVHANEDEAFFVLEGSIDVILDGERIPVGEGGFAFGPRGVPHTYEVTSDVARLLIISTPGGVEGFFRQLGEPATSLTVPVPKPPDVGAVVETAAEHGITVLVPA